MWPSGGAIFGPRAIIWTNFGKDPLGDAAYQIIVVSDKKFFFHIFPI